MSDLPGYPARLNLEGPLEIKNWRPLVNWFLAIPQFLVAGVLRIVRQVLQFVAFFTVLFTKKIPRGVFDMIVMTIRYGWRVDTYALWMRETYPPFEFTPASDDPGGDPASVSVDYPEELNRWLPLVKWLLAIPHYFVLLFLYLGAIFVGVGAFLAVLFAGRYPEGMRSYLIGVNRWKLRVLAYAGFLRDEYPPFSLE
jgi:roadblock/LC7 domain-containing protein